MMKRFKKLLSALCIIALLASSIATVFANGDPEAEMPAVQETAAEANATDNTEAAAAPAAVEEAPAQESTPVTVEEAPAQETAPATVEETPVQETAPVTVEEAPVQETAPTTVEEAPVQETAPATVEEAPVQETTPVTVEEAPAQETAPATVEETPVQETAPVTVEETPVQETTPVTVEEAPVQETAPATVEEAPAQETASETMEEAPTQGTVPETVEETPAQNDEPAADTTPAQEETADLNAAPVQEDTAPANEADENSEESVDTEENTPADEIDELANEPVNYSEDELAELEDDGGYIDPEFVAENIPEITPEMKYENIREMKIGSAVSGSAGTDELLYYIKAARNQTIVLVLQANGNIQVRINERAVNFTENEDGTKSYEMKVLYNETYIIGISGQGTFTLSAETKIVEEPEEEVEEEIDTVDGRSETPAVEGETAEINEVNDNAENNSNLNSESAETTDEATAAETEVPAEPAEEGIAEVEQTEVENAKNTQAAIAENVENNTEEATASTENTELAEEKPAETSKPKIINTWVTANNNEEEGTVTVYANADIELDNQIVWQTRSADSEEWKKAGYGLKLTVEVTEENANNFFRFKLADGEFSPEYQIHATVKAAEEETEEEAEEIPVETETEETIDSEETEEEAASVENTEEDAAEEVVTEEAVETEAEAVSEETAETMEGTEEAAAETEVTEEAETEAVEGETETEEETAEEAEPEEETEETEEEVTEEETEDEEAEPLTEEQLIELGYRKIQILNQNGTNLYDNTTEEATVIKTAETGTELWIKDVETEGWAEIYTEEDAHMYLKFAEIEKQPPTDEEMLAKGYVKVFVGIDIGANVYSSMDAEEAVDHLDAGTEMWVKLIAGADRAEIYSEEENDPSLYISLVDIIARLKPEGMGELPTRELIGKSTLYDYEIAYYGTEITMTVELVNFNEDDVYEVNWQYSADGEEYFDIEDAHDLIYKYELSEENASYYWKITVVLITPQE